MVKNLKNRRKISRRKPGTKSSGDYFSKETQKAILDYQTTTDIPEKQKIYVEKILPAFDALVENLINVYGFKVMHESKQDLKIECSEFLFTTVDKFDGTKGSKAFSYFNVVGKNWLTIKSKQNAKKIKTYISTDDKDSFTQSDIDKLSEEDRVKSPEETLLDKENSGKHKRIIQEVAKKVKSENEKICVEGIMEIVNNLEDIEILSKRGMLCYLRTLTGLNSKQLSVVMSSLKKHYKEVKKELENEDS